MGVQVSDKNGKRLSVTHSAYRFIAVCLPLYPFVIYASLPSTIEASQKAEAIALGDSIAFAAFQQTPDGQIMNNLLIAMAVSVVASLIWYMPIAFTKQKTGLHDLLCKTRVYRKTKNEIT